MLLFARLMTSDSSSKVSSAIVISFNDDAEAAITCLPVLTSPVNRCIRILRLFIDITLGGVGVIVFTFSSNRGSLLLTALITGNEGVLTHRDDVTW